MRAQSTKALRGHPRQLEGMATSERHHMPEREFVLRFTAMHGLYTLPQHGGLCQRAAIGSTKLLVTEYSKQPPGLHNITNL